MLKASEHTLLQHYCDTVLKICLMKDPNYICSLQWFILKFESMPLKLAADAEAVNHTWPADWPAICVKVFVNVVEDVDRLSIIRLLSMIAVKVFTAWSQSWPFLCLLSFSQRWLPAVWSASCLPSSSSCSWFTAWGRRTRAATTWARGNPMEQLIKKPPPRSFMHNVPSAVARMTNHKWLWETVVTTVNLFKHQMLQCWLRNIA